MNISDSAGMRLGVNTGASEMSWDGVLTDNVRHFCTFVDLPDQSRPSDEVVEVFLESIRNNPDARPPVNSLVGTDQPTIFTVIYDMYHNAKSLEFEKFLDRHTAIGGQDFKKHANSEHFKDKLTFLKYFYRYCKESYPEQMKWDTWLGFQQEQHIKLDCDSLSEICPLSKQIMVYGWGHTAYAQVIRFLKEEEDVRPDGFKKVFDFKLGNKIKKEETFTTLEGRKIDRIDYESKPDREHCPYICKSALVNLVLENCKRQHENLPLIPLIFCYDIVNNPHPTSTPETISTKEPKHNDLVTNKELRRIFKLCHFKDNDFVAEVARKTVKFVKLCENEYDGYQHNYHFEEVEPFWQKADWDVLWSQRLANQAPKQPKILRWEDELLKRL